MCIVRIRREMRLMSRASSSVIVLFMAIIVGMASSRDAMAQGTVEHTVAENPMLFWALLVALATLLVTIVKREVAKFEEIQEKQDAKFTALFAKLDSYGERLSKIEIEHALLTKNGRVPCFGSYANESDG